MWYTTTIIMMSQLHMQVETEVGSPLPQEYISCLQSVAFLLNPFSRDTLLEHFTVILSYSVGPVYLEECKLCPFLIYFFFFTKLACPS